MSVRSRAKKAVSKAKAAVKKTTRKASDVAKKTAEKVGATIDNVADKAAYLPAIQWVPAMNLMIKRKDSNWQFSTDVVLVTDTFYKLYVAKDHYMDEGASVDHVDKVAATMNGEDYSEVSHFIPPEAIELAVGVIFKIVGAAAKKVKEGKASKEEAELVKTAEVAKEATEKAKAEAKAEADREDENGIPNWVMYLIGAVVAVIVIAIIYKMAK